MMYGPMRIGGLASGMDIDQIVSDLMKAEHMRVDKHAAKTGHGMAENGLSRYQFKAQVICNTSFDMKLAAHI